MSRFLFLSLSLPVSPSLSLPVSPSPNLPLSTRWLWLTLLLALALRLPGWFTQDEKTRFRLFEPDEYQHVEIAVYQLQRMEPGLLSDWEVAGKIFNARGYGIQLGVLAWLGHRLFAMPLQTDTLVLLGRALSTCYGLLLIGLVFWMGRHFFRDRWTPLFAALLLCLCDLHVTYSRYAVPAATYVFWAYLFAFSWYRFIKRYEEKERLAGAIGYLSVAALSAATTFAVKFDFIPWLIVLISLPVLMVWRTWTWKRSGLVLLAFTVLWLLAFGLVTTFGFTPAQIDHAFWDLYQQNKDVIPVDQHVLHNPFLYLIAVLAGVGLPAFLLALWGTRRLLLRSSGRTLPVLLFTAFLLLEFAVLWNMDTPFVRRALIFMPAVSLLAAYAWRHIPDRSWRLGIAVATIFYTLVLTLTSQSNAWWDTRYQARTYLQQEQAEVKIKYGGYAFAQGMPPGISLREAEDILVLHEAEYSRYWRSFTTPFKRPHCCSEVYHCQEAACRKIQQLLSGEHPDYRLLRHFPTREWTPERVLFKRYLGNYETFLGDVLIFEKLPGY